MLPLSAVPATKAAVRGSQSAAPATKCALRGSQSAVPATKSALRGSQKVLRLDKVLRLSRDLHFELHKVLGLEVHRVLHLPRILRTSHISRSRDWISALVTPGPVPRPQTCVASAFAGEMADLSGQGFLLCLCLQGQHCKAKRARTFTGHNTQTSRGYCPFRFRAHEHGQVCKHSRCAGAWGACMSYWAKRM